MINIRYSRAFKMQVVREFEEGRLSATQLMRKYGIKGLATVMRWVRRHGSGRYGRIIRVETPDEMAELERVRRELRRAKEALADAHIELALEKAYLQEACVQLNQSVEGFKKKRTGRRRTGRLKPTRD